MIRHLFFTRPGIYTPIICPRSVVWQRVPDNAPTPLYGVWVESVENARKFAQVTVIRDGQIVKQLESVRE
jgi:hypothetical protein